LASKPPTRKTKERRLKKKEKVNKQIIKIKSNESSMNDMKNSLFIVCSLILFKFETYLNLINSSCNIFKIIRQINLD
jgi:hypothetical protein